MLQALNEIGENVTLALLARNDIAHLRKNKVPFYCPICKNKLVIKAGPQVIPHFAHQMALNCPNHARGEGVYHERGKLDLYAWFKKQGYPVTLEYYLPEIRQRSDLFVHHGNKRIAIEFQCATIPIKEILERTKGYQSLGIIPIWILGGNRMKRFGNQGLHLTSTEQQFLTQYAKDDLPKLLYYCPNTKQLARYDLISLTSQSRSVGHLNFSKLHKTSFAQILSSPNCTKLSDQWLKEKRRFRLYTPKKSYSYERQFREWLYLNQLFPSLLSSWVGLPVSGQWMMKVPIWTWQAQICYDFFNKHPQFTIDQLQFFSKSYRKNAEAQFLLIQKNLDPILEYLSYFIFLGKIVEKEGTFILKGRINQYKSIEDALRNDRHLHITLKSRMELLDIKEKSEV